MKPLWRIHTTKHCPTEFGWALIDPRRDAWAAESFNRPIVVEHVPPLRRLARAIWNWLGWAVVGWKIDQ